MGVDLLERADELEQLDSALTAAGEGHGSVVLVAGEAGIGKSTLIRSFLASVEHRARVLSGSCEDLVTPRTLGAVRDAFTGRSARVERILDDSARDDLFVGVLAELTDPARPTVLVVEDVHWADDATIDVLRYVSRRIEGSPAVLLVSYRDDEIHRAHPAQRLLGGIGGVPTHRLTLQRLSRFAVNNLAGGSVTSSTAIYQLTGGNPFYTTEVIASGADAVPRTAADAVLARVHQLPAPVQTALDQLSVVPSHVELPLARALLGGLGVLAEAERRGMLTIGPEAVAFRHELARRAVEGALPVSERMRLNAAVLEVLTAHDDVDLPRAVHHATEAGDDASVVDLAPRAAARASQAGSYAQEISYYRLLLARRHLLGSAEVASTRQRLSIALWVVDELPESLEHGLEAVRIRERLGDVAALGDALIALPGPQYGLAHTRDALASSARAVELLGSVPETPTRTMALLWNALGVGAIGYPALALARDAAASAARTGSPELVAMSGLCLGRARLLAGEHKAGLESMRAGLTAAREAHAHTIALMTYGFLAQDLFDLTRYDESRQWVDEAIAYMNEREVRLFVERVGAQHRRLQALRGAWDDAVAGLREIVDASREGEKGGLRYALAPLARLLARRGDDDAPDLLAWARDYARRADCYDDWLWTGQAEIEAAWLTRRPADATEAITRLDGLTARAGRETARGELYRWKRRLGLPHEIPDHCPEPYAAGLRGDWARAADAWEALGAPYEQALELLDSRDIDATMRAVRILDDLGADPAATLARTRLRALGATQIPPRPRAATRANPAGLTDRQLDILRLVNRGLTDAEIAAELVLSTRTVGHHVSAVLHKLDAPNRRRARDIAERLGIET